MDDHKHNDVSISASIPDLKIPDYLKKLDGKTIVFDDLERCSIPIPQVLGYINQYVETCGLKVIIIANEDEIIRVDVSDNKEDGLKRYLTIKEKLIGKSFDVQMEAYYAATHFINALDDESCKSYLTENLGPLMLTFYDAGYRNLRNLKNFYRFTKRFTPSLRSYAAELWIKGVTGKYMDSAAIGHTIGKHEQIELAPLKRFTDLVISNMFQISNKHNKELESLLACCIEKMSDAPISGCKKLLEIYAEVLSVNKSKLSNEGVIARLTAWESTETLKKVIQKLKIV